MLLFNLPGPCSGFEIKQKKCELMISVIALFKVDGSLYRGLVILRNSLVILSGLDVNLHRFCFQRHNFVNMYMYYHVKCKFNMFCAPCTDFRTTCVESV